MSDVVTTCGCGTGAAAGTGRKAVGVHPGLKQRNLHRLRRIEGQIRGLQKMVEEEKYCIDILTQVSAATRALESVALSLLDDHLRHCMVHFAQEPGRTDDKVAEASAAIARLVRS